MPSTVLARTCRSAAGLMTIALLASCSSSTDEEADATDSPEVGSSGNFPVTIEHEFGETTIESEPERVVTLGVTDADIALALGTVPVGNTGYTFFDGGLGPWTDDLVDGHDLTFIESDTEPDLEEVAALDPDLIVGISAGFDEGVYDQLTEIAPVVARPTDTAAYTVPREEATEIVAQALGQEVKGRELNEQTEELIAAARTENPDFDGKTGTSVLPYEGKYGAYLPGDARGQFLDALGFELPEVILSQDTGESFFVELSPENVSQLDGDLLLVLADEEDLDITEGNPLFDDLDVVKNDAVVVATIEERGAITYNSVLSIPYALENLVPRLADALE